MKGLPFGPSRARGNPDDPAFYSLQHLLGDPLGEQQWPGDVHLPLVADIGRWDVDGCPASPTPVLDKDLDVPSQRLTAVSVIDDVKLFDLQRNAAVGRLPLESLDLGVDLDGGDDIKALFGKSHDSLMTESGARAGDQYFS